MSQVTSWGAGTGALAGARITGSIELGHPAVGVGVIALSSRILRTAVTLVA